VSTGEVADKFVDAFVQRVNADFACGGVAMGEKIEGVYSVREEDLL
jgi:lipoyl(octanoyl) transferase